MSARIIAVMNQKGGVGKTTTAVNLAAGLAKAGRKVLVMDVDPQANLTTGLLRDKPAADKTLKGVFQNKVSLSEVIHHTDTQGLELIPSHISLAVVETELLGKIGRETVLKKAITSDIRERYDYIILDAPPSLGLFSVNILAAADEVLIPIQTEFYAMDGVAQLLEVVKLVQDNLNGSLKVGAVLLTMFDARTKLAAEVKEQVVKAFGQNVLSAVIPRNIKLAEAPSYGKSIFLYAPDSQGAKAYEEATVELLKMWGDYSE
ncbi:MAG: nitrogenase (iron protein) [Candidatus Methanoperedens nitroreducens]|uniref:Nitrogenase (Iron protein) n=1 Tax=Candidatus Methanoperedens nitratireducens TaxID=1392998 RepID=A0A0P8AHQ2_9EURY|nr:MAG: nitrogenase (iron protein) [Candidatus Methanoperedens sp. BLZ1]